MSENTRELIVIVAEGCESCMGLLEDLRSNNAKVKVMDVTKSLKAARIVRDLGIDRVPTIVTVEETENGKEICALDENGRVKCVNSSGQDDF